MSECWKTDQYSLHMFVTLKITNYIKVLLNFEDSIIRIQIVPEISQIYMGNT